MSSKIKQDINRSGAESTSFPSACENCLPDNAYVQMLKEDFGRECKICTRPFTLFTWKADRTSRQKSTVICLTCARLKNCCQCCMLDLSFGLPITVRDAALKMIAPGPQSNINREYYAQEHERELEEGRGAVEEYAKTDEKARDLLRRLANSEPYYKKQRRLEAEETERPECQRRIGDGSESEGGSGSVTGPVRTADSRRNVNNNAPTRGGRNIARAVGNAARPPQPEDWLPPRDPNITSLFVTGVEDDLPEHAIRTFFTPFGQLRSLVCSHRSHCAFINYATREAAETAAAHCQGKAVIQGCPLRVKWGKPRPLDNTDRDQRMEWAREGRQTAAAVKAAHGGQRDVTQGGSAEGTSDDQGRQDKSFTVAAPPGSKEVKYASLAGD